LLFLVASNCEPENFIYLLHSANLSSTELLIAYMTYRPFNTTNVDLDIDPLCTNLPSKNFLALFLGSRVTHTKGKR